MRKLIKKVVKRGHTRMGESQTPTINSTISALYGQNSKIAHFIDLSG